MSNDTRIIITLTDPNGIRLRTKDKFCDKDIDIIPDLSAASTLQEKTVTANGEVTPDEGYDALSKVTVAIPVYAGETQSLDEITFTVDDVELHAKEGWTWADWIVDPAYNTIGSSIEADTNKIVHCSLDCYVCYAGGGDVVLASEPIEAGYEYEITGG